MRIAWLVYSYEMRIYYAIRRRAVATLSHVRSCTLLRVFLAFLVLLVSPHFNGNRKSVSQALLKDRKGMIQRYVGELQTFGLRYCNITTMTAKPSIHAFEESNSRCRKTTIHADKVGNSFLIFF